MIVEYKDKAAYTTAEYPTDESRVALIKEDKEIKIDGVNVVTNTPCFGDACYIKDGKYKFIKGGDGFDHSALVANGYTDIGQVIGIKDGKAMVLDKSLATTAKFADVLQYAITAITDTSLVITLYNKSGVAKTINVTLTSAEINQTSADEISAQVANVDTNDWWAYLDGNRIIIQCDTWANYAQYQCSMTGGSISFVTWEDMPITDSYVKANSRKTNYRGLMNIEKGYAYWSTHGRTPDSNVAVHSEAGNTNPMTEAAYNTSAYAAEIRAYYPTYKDYLRGEFAVMWPQKYGCFSERFDPVKLTKKYGNKTAPTKSGGTKYKFTALHYALALDYNVDGLRAGDFYLMGVNEGTIIMEDNNMAVINALRTKMGHSLITNTSYRWFAERYSVNGAWFFNAGSGSLGNSDVDVSYIVQGVVLLDF